MRVHQKPPLTTYVALLRGVNVGGNNMIRMSLLRASFVRLGFEGVSTYINSGNVVFKAKPHDPRKREREIGEVLRTEYNLDCKTVVRSFAEIEELLQGLPADWGGDPAWKYNVMFLRHTIDSKTILDGLHPRPGIEEVLYRPGTLLWAARTSDVSRSAMSKLPGLKIYQDMTVRNLNTTRNLCEIMRKTAAS